MGMGHRTAGLIGDQRRFRHIGTLGPVRRLCQQVVEGLAFELRGQAKARHAGKLGVDVHDQGAEVGIPTTNNLADAESNCAGVYHGADHARPRLTLIPVVLFIFLTAWVDADVTYSVGSLRTDAGTAVHTKAWPMPEADGAPGRRDDRSPDRRDSDRTAPLYAALDLGTNNCRLLIARPARSGFRVVDSFSRIVRLGEGLTHSGRLSDAAMARAHEALAICAERILKKGLPAARVRAVATQACRIADNGAAFVDRVRAEPGLARRIIDPVEEARLSVKGCENLFDPTVKAVLVVDVGGGSTEISWLRNTGRGEGRTFETVTWMSAPLGVVTLAERHPEPKDPTADWYEAMVADVMAAVAKQTGADALKATFSDGGAHMVGTSGAITSLAGVHLRLPRYNRDRVDGLWMTRGDCERAADRLMALGPKGRADEPCIGPERADLVLAGAAILEGIQRSWPCERVRVADRGLREGLLLSAMRDARRRNGGRRRRSR